jgi:HEAT repeat protein
MTSAQPPPGTPYEEIDDWHNRRLLDANGVGTDERDLLAALNGPDEQERPLAAQALGRTGGPDSIPALLAAAGSDDDHLAVAAADALARRGDRRGVAVLRELLDRPVSTSVGPLMAAGALAREGSPDGYPAVRDGLAAGNFLVRIAAAKQLYYFLALDGRACPDGSRVDVFAGYRQALSDANDDVRWAALYQLRFVSDPRVTDLIAEFLDSAPVEWLANEAHKLVTR